MTGGIGQRIGETIIVALWPLIWVCYVLVSVVVFAHTAAVYLGWGILSRLDRRRPGDSPSPGPQAAP